MSRTARIGVTRRALAVAALLSVLVVVFILAAPTQSQAIGKCPGEFYYYNNASHDVLVGYLSYGCNNCHITRWGTFSAYYDFYSLNC
jgi:hypothetical protein